MSAVKIGMPSGCISMTNRTVDKLLSDATGDGALLFLYLLRAGGFYDPAAAAKALRWDSAKVTEVFAHLETLELVKGVTVEQSPAPKANQAPEYTTEMISDELSAPNSEFSALQKWVEQKLGAPLNLTSLKMLMELYDYLSLPTEVIYLLVTYVCEEVSYRHGDRQRPRMSQIKQMGYRWANKGLDTLEAAEAYIKKMDYFRSREGALLRLVGITDRRATEREREYLNSWIEMGFGDEVIALAYDKTLFHTKKWNWNYCNGILKNWHGKGLHTLEEVTSEGKPATAAAADVPVSTAQEDDLNWLLSQT